MRRRLCLYLQLVMMVALFGCVSSKVTPNATEPSSLSVTTLPTIASMVSPPSPSPTVIPLIITSTLFPTQTTTPTPPATLEPQQAEAALRKLLRESECLAPCFWGIIPGQSTASEVKSIFTHLGLPFEHTVEPGGKEFYALLHKFDGGLILSIGLELQDGIVKNIDMFFNPEKPEDPTAPREWLAYSLETLIKQFGVPSRVEFFGHIGHSSGSQPGLAYEMNLYFDTVNLIIEYLSAYDYIKSDPMADFVHICPLTDQFHYIRIWPGKNPDNPPLPAFPVEDATSMTLKEFSALMTGEAEDACFDLSKEIFQ